MPVDTPASNLVRQLSRVGLRPDERLVRRIVDMGDEGRAALLELATDTSALHEELPVALGPLHALRLLGELPDPAIVAPLLDVLPVTIVNDQDVPARLFATEVLQIIGRVGAPVVPVLWAYADDAEKRASSRAAAVSAFSFVATYAPETRDEIVAECRRRFAAEGDGPLVGGLVTALAELGDAASYKAVMAAFREGRVGQDDMPAALARQFILGGGRRDLSCVSHTLFERYDHHGPRFRDPDEIDQEELI